MTTTSEDQRELARLGERLGGLCYAQGAGGNVSVKTVDGDLLVKASGVRLRDVGQVGAFSRVPLELARRAAAGDADADRALFGIQPRPSLETYFHTLRPRVVAHTHAIWTTLLACSRYSHGDDLGLGAVHVPYARPGRELWEVLRQRVPVADECVIILRNHGLLVGADTAERAIELTAAAESAARARVKDAGSFERVVATLVAAPIARVAGVLLRSLPPHHGLGSTPSYLFPDAAVCCTEVRTEDGVDLMRAGVEALAAFGRSVLMVNARGERCLAATNEQQLTFATEVLAAHDWIRAGLAYDDSAELLPAGECERIVTMPSEQYRISAAAASAVS